MQYSDDIDSKSGKKISVLVFEASLNPKLTLIESHGGIIGPKEKVAEDNKQLIEFAAKNNVNYVSIDLSNNGTHPDQPFNELRFSHRVRDVETVIDYVIRKYKCPIILIGSSLGGLITLNSALYSPDIKGLILNCAAVKAHICVEHTMNKNEFDNWQSRGLANVWDIPMQYDFYTDLVKLDAMKIIPNIRVPILWFHGTDDQTVPITQAQEAEQSNPNIQLTEVLGGGHRFGNNMQPGEWEHKIESFILSILNMRV